MRKTGKHSLTSLCVAIISALGLMAMAAPQRGDNRGDDNSGSWTLEPYHDTGRADMVQLSFKRSGKWGKSSHSRGYKASDLKGLSLTGTGRRDVAFSLPSDAGVIEAEGIMQDRKGTGFFEFRPDAAYFRAMARLGFDDIAARDQVAYALHDVSLEYARGMAGLKLKGLDADHLIAMRVHNVSADYVKAVRKAGFDPESNHVIAMRIHDVTPEFVKAVKAAGLTPGLDDLLALKIHNASPDFIRAVKKAYPNTGADGIIAMSIHNVDIDYIEGMRRAFPDAAADQIVATRIHDVTPGFITDIKKLGFDPTLDQFVALRIHNATPRYIANLREKGIKTQDVEKIIALRIHGVD